MPQWVPASLILRTIRTDELFAKATVGAAVFLIVFLAGYLIESRPPYDAFGYLIGRDFVNMWMGGRAALSGHIHMLLDFREYTKSLHALFPTLPDHNWSYPPDLLLFVWPLGFLPYFLALILWSVIGLFVWGAASFPYGGTKQQLAFLMSGPAVAINLFAGQNGFFTGAILVLALSNLKRRPWLAGIFFGLMTMKPQLGLLIPIALLLRRQWGSLATGALVSAVLFAITACCFGLSVWSDYVNLVLPVQSAIMKDAHELMPIMMPSAFMNVRILGLSSSIGFFAQLPFTVFAIGAVIWTYYQERDETVSNAVLVTACFVATPYVFNYDMVVFGWVVWSLREKLVTEWDRRIALAVWVLPVITMVMGLCRIPGSALVLAAFLLRLLWLLRADAQMIALREVATA